VILLLLILIFQGGMKNEDLTSEKQEVEPEVEVLKEVEVEVDVEVEDEQPKGLLARAAKKS
jgi:uncharacterized protein (DUF58 family)